MTTVPLYPIFRTRPKTSRVPDVTAKLASIKFRPSSDPSPLSDGLLRVESSSFMNAVLASEYSPNMAATCFVLTQKSANSISRWDAFLSHRTKQFFIKAPFASSHISKQNVMFLLDLAEQFKAREARVCVSRAEPNRDTLISELISLGFDLLSPRSQPIVEFDVLQFRF
eukprot:c14744_g1_i1.p2 GENE.c14744_g1_i1~~c14744_g1_i1.p2  ORF type:complete len:169 (-),score=12.14 c14744_g1_i1:343-849(-)